jgi:HNH endonuclease
VRGFVANTDFDWFQVLRRRPELYEVNFWQPSGGRGFHVVAPGGVVFFRLKSPRNAIGGFGFFARHAILPAWHAWDTFGEGNGSRTFAEMRARIERYRRRAGNAQGDPHGNYLIGCILLVDPVFFAEDEWVDEPNDWSPNIVSGKGYDLSVGEGARIIRECLSRLNDSLNPSLRDLRESAERYGIPRLIAPRLGQGTFRIAVEEAYARSCAVTGEHSLPVLEAAHIRPYAQDGPHSVPNGLLMRRDIHRLFDLGYVTVTPDEHFVLSRALKDEYENGRTYYAMHGDHVEFPVAAGDRPSPCRLEWHNENVFRG